VAIPAFLARLSNKKALHSQTCLSAIIDRKGLSGGVTTLRFLLGYFVALILVLLSLFGMLLWPAWSEVERRRAIVDALTGEGAAS
jgi:hypothetical protein